MNDNKNKELRVAALSSNLSKDNDQKTQFSIADSKSTFETNQSENWSDQEFSEPRCEYEASTIDSTENKEFCLETGGSNYFSDVAQAIQSDAIAILGSNPKRQHSQVFEDILNNLSEVDFRAFADIPSDRPVPQKVQIVVVIQEVLRTARNLNCRLCRKGDFIYAYNGEFWKIIEKPELESFLGEAAERLGVVWTDARYHRMRAELVKQFFVDANLPTAPKRNEEVLINLRNGTFVFSKTEPVLRDFNSDDFLTYQLPFEYDPEAEFSKWQKFLDKVIPDKLRQLVLAQYIGYVFARHLKLEKTLILYGSGANGKSVVFNLLSCVVNEL
jgi:putative DNA primase/helicase